ncbi:MAG: polyprenyl synthetase family protein, partial [Rikenellaceae bacterium]
MILSVDKLIELFEERIQSIALPAEPKNLYTPIQYTLEAGGKRIRPIMVLVSCNIFSDNIEKAMNGALAIEVFHNFTLLHDDIMDNADVRRARATVHKKWNTNVAILSGDTMLIHSYKLLAKCHCEQFHNVFDSFNTLAALVCEGQQIDMDFETTADVEINRYIDMIALKTSALIAGALQIGAQIAGANVKECELLYNFGMNLGNAFQLQDDMLDTYGDEKT